jgi:hypothetical protein
MNARTELPLALGIIRTCRCSTIGPARPDMHQCSLSHLEDPMQNMDRWSVQGKVLAATAGAFLMLSITSPAKADNSVRWRTIVGIVQAGNTVGNIPGGGQPWTALGGRVRVDLAASQVSFDVQGLVLAGGNTIGTPDGITQVKGTLICDAGGTNVTLDTVSVPLSPQGDADFSGPIGPIPTTCNPSNVAFLIRIAAGRWIANGAVRTSPGND